MRSKEIASNFWVWRYFFFDVGDQAGPGRSAALRRHQVAGQGRAGRQPGPTRREIRPRPWAQRSSPAAISLPAREQLVTAWALPGERSGPGPGRSSAIRRQPWPTRREIGPALEVVQLPGGYQVAGQGVDGWQPGLTRREIRPRPWAQRSSPAGYQVAGQGAAGRQPGPCQIENFR